MSEENGEYIISQEKYDALSIEEQQEYDLVQLIELSPATIKNYRDAAKDDILDLKHGGPGGVSLDQRDGESDKDLNKREKDLTKTLIARRRSGIKMANNKLKKLGEAAYDSIGESAASDTLKPGSRSVADPKSKIETITAVIGAMHSMRKDDLTKWYTQAMDLIGKEADSLPSGANADANASTIDTKLGKGPKTRDPMPKISVKEDVEEMFEGQDLSEEF